MELKRAADILKALADPTRLTIMALLQARECCVCELVPIFQISQPAISKHLQRLKGAELVLEQRRGQWVFYSVNQEKFDEIREFLGKLPDFSHELKKLEKQGLLVCSEEDGTT